MNKCFLVALGDEVGNIDMIENVPVFISGIGKLNSAVATSKLINMGYTEIINIGSCGSKKHSVGEVIKIGKHLQDIDITPILDYGYSSENEYEIISDEASIYSCFTTDYFYEENQKIKYSENYIKKINNCSVFDMESFAIAKMCKENNIKFNCYKWVSDDGGYDNWRKNCDVGFNKFKDLYLKSII